LILAAIVLLVGGGVVAWYVTRTVDTTPPEAILEEVEPNKPLFDEGEQQVTFVLTDDQGGIPTFFIFDAEDQKTTAGGINLLRGTPNEQGVEIRFEAVRFFRDEDDPDQLWPRAVGIANESGGKTPISLSTLESGEPIEMHFHDEIEVPLVAHVVYDIYMTIQYDPKTQLLTLTDCSGGIRWKMLLSDAYDDGKLETTITGRKGEYGEKPLLDLPGD
jgi:hypothetical protein